MRVNPAAARPMRRGHVTESLKTSPPQRYAPSMDLAQALLDSLPDGCELRTSVADIGRGWEATAQIIHTTDTPKPVPRGHGPTEEDALHRALDGLASFWKWRTSPIARDYPR